jgi:hypothetical protein
VDGGKVEGNASKCKIKKADYIEPQAKLEIVRTFDEYRTFTGPTAPKSNCERHNIGQV